MTLVLDVIEHQHHASGHGDARGRPPGDLAAARRVAVARQVDVVDLEREPQLRQQLTGENHGPAHHDQHERKTVRQRGGNLPRHARDRCGDVRGRAKQLRRLEHAPRLVGGKCHAARYFGIRHPRLRR